MLRIMKVIAAVLVALLGLLHLIGNLSNLQAAFGFVGAVTTGAEQPFYNMFGPPLASPVLQGIALSVILLCEFCVGLLGLAGAAKMLKNLTAPAAAFAAATVPAVMACALGMLLWLGIFIIIGEGYFIIWQMQAGAGPIEGAMRYGTVCGLFMLFLLLAPDGE